MDSGWAAFLGAIAGGFIAGVISIILTLMNNKHQVEREDKKYKREYIERKIDRIKKVYAAIIEFSIPGKISDRGKVASTLVDMFHSSHDDELLKLAKELFGSDSDEEQTKIRTKLLYKLREELVKRESELLTCK